VNTMTRQELIDAIADRILTNICEGYDGGLEAWAEDVLKDGREGAPLHSMTNQELRDYYAELTKEEDAA
jgi:hypothetical protein